MATTMTRRAVRSEIGRGRSGVVYADVDDQGNRLACKVFESRGLTKVVQWLAFGAPNPYVWNKDAVQCAKLRRNILKTLLPLWTDGKVGVADVVAAVRNEDDKTFELQTEMVDGWAAHLHHPMSNEFEGEAEHLWRDVMPAIRAHLQIAGFYGLLWQAGEGNPVSLNNFLFEEDEVDEQSGATRKRAGKWVWIDLESGVPAIFPISLRVLFSYSIRHWWRLGRPMFDDVDVSRLIDHLESQSEELTRSLGTDSYQILLSNADRLQQHQQNWKSVGRTRSSILYRLARGDIDQKQASYFADHQFQWLMKEARRCSDSAAKLLAVGFKSLLKKAKSVDLLKVIGSTWRFLISQKYREEFIHGILRQSINKWRERGQMNASDAERLLTQVGTPDASVFVTDFGIHLAIKPVVKATQYWILPALFALGILGGATVATLILAGGAIARSTYTLGRLVQSAAQGCEKPWIALGIGVLPVIGNLAYPAQMVFSSKNSDEKLAKFMMDDGFARVGRHLPIWGGQDTWTEHMLNRIPHRTSQFFQSRRILRGSERGSVK